MKKLLFATILFCGCETTVKRENTGQKMYGQDIQIVTIDSCEYIYFPNGNASWGSHKGNCKFCNQRK